jgi:hypothetical protein
MAAIAQVWDALISLATSGLGNLWAWQPLGLATSGLGNIWKSIAPARDVGVNPIFC